MIKQLIHRCIVFLLFITTSCYEPVYFDVPGEQKLVINALFNPDSVWTIHVSKSLPVLTPTEVPSVNNATIQLYEDGTLVEELFYGTDGMYTSTQKPKEGKLYTIKASTPGLPAVQASEILSPAKVEIT